MLIHPSIFIQILVSSACTILICIGCLFAVGIVKDWDIQSGSEKQIRLEKRTYLISTLVGFCFAACIANFIFFIQTCESISNQFVGAMCATGVLNANPYGWPCLMLKILIFFSGMFWLFLNHLDSKGYDYPLTRLKYGLLLILAPLMLSETVNLTLFFSKLEPDLIVSCCGSMFSASSQGVAAHVSGVHPKSALILLSISGIIILVTGVLTIKMKSLDFLYSLSALAGFVVALVSMVSLISVYIYEHPHHHCPFCMLKSGYHYIGYFLYIPLFLATATGGCAPAIKWCRTFSSLKSIAPQMAHKLIIFSCTMFFVFYVLAAAAILKSNLTMKFWYT